MLAEIAPTALVAILERLLHEGWQAARGLPDLILLPGPPIVLESFPRRLGSELCLVELKSPKDTLSDAQRFWLHTLIKEGSRAEVWRVEFQET